MRRRHWRLCPSSGVRRNALHRMRLCSLALRCPSATWTSWTGFSGQSLNQRGVFWVECPHRHVLEGRSAAERRSNLATRERKMYCSFLSRYLVLRERAVPAKALHSPGHCFLAAFRGRPCEFLVWGLCNDFAVTGRIRLNLSSLLLPYSVAMVPLERVAFPFLSRPGRPRHRSRIFASPAHHGERHAL